MVLSTALFDRPAFKNVIVNGLVLAEDGRKMSKRLKNYPDPMYIVNSYGADALRLYMISSPVVRAEDLCFSEEGVKHALRHLLIPWWNAYSFFVTYARVDGWKPEGMVNGQWLKRDGSTSHQPSTVNRQPSPLLDRWILSSLERLTGEVVKAMDAYDLQQAVRPFIRFVEDLTNWYIRRSRRRFWKSSDDADKAQAYATLYEVLVRLSKIAAPFVPFTSEAIYRNLRTDDMPESVHLCDFPVSGESARDLDLEAQMDDVMAVVGLGRQLRADNDLKVRQPLKGLHVVSRDAARLKRIEALRELVTEELNVRDVWFGSDESSLATFSAKANFSRLGPRLGGAMKKAAGLIQKLDVESLETLLRGESVSIDVDGKPVELTAEDVVVNRSPKPGLVVASAGSIVVALETELTPELLREGLAREFVNKVQNMRKAAGLDVTQRIRLFHAGDEVVREALAEHIDYIQTETLCVHCAAEAAGAAGAESWDLNGRPCLIRMEKAEG